MQSNFEIPVSKRRRLTGLIMSYFAVLFILFDSIVKVLKLAPAVEATVQLGYPESLIIVIGTIELVCIIIYVIPGTSHLGAILLTGYLGGAVATNLRVGTPLFSNILFPVYMGILLWGGLYLRDNIVRSIFSFQKGGK